jgi:putative hemolysin
MFADIAIVLALIVLNGVLAMSELAVVSSRPARLRPLAERSAGARAALALGEDPGRFLSTVQIGITLVGVLSGAVSGATLGVRLAAWLEDRGLRADLADTLGVGGVVVILTYLSLIVGELVPKRIALRNPEAVAIRVAPAMRLLCSAAAPVVWFLDVSGRLLLWLLGQSGAGSAKVTEEEVRTLLTEAREEGVIEAEEREMISGVMRLADRSARALMTPRREVEMIDAEGTPAETLAAIRKIGRARIPVRRAETDEVLGIVTLQDVFTAVSRRETLNLEEMIREVPVVSDRADALDVLEVLRETAHHIVLVYDEYGQFQGIVTTGDVLHAITGELGGNAADEPAVVERADGSLLVSGTMPVDEFCDRLGIRQDLAGGYETVAGLVLNLLHRLPALGDAVDAGGWRIEVVDMDDRRIDKLLVSRATVPAA